MTSEINGVTMGSGIKWPNNSRIAVALTFEFDAEILRISQSELLGKTATVEEKEKGWYGAYEGIWRCLRMLDTQDIKATFFVPGRVIELYEDTVQRSEALIQKITGKKPLGHRAPHGIVRKHTYDLIEERSYLYSSNLRDCDWAYLHKTANGSPLVEIPTDVNLDDYTYFFYSSAVEPPHRAVYTNREYIEILKEEFDALALEEDKVFCLKLHPQFIGRAGRINALSDFVGYMKQNGAWFATCEEISNYVIDRENNQE